MCEEPSRGLHVPDPDWQAMQGEVVSLSETLAVSPIGGRVRRRHVEVGEPVTAGAILVEVVSGNGQGTRTVEAREAGVFLGWLAWDGESVAAGTLLARLAPNANGTTNGSSRAQGRER